MARAEQAAAVAAARQCQRALAARWPEVVMGVSARVDEAGGAAHAADAAHVTLMETYGGVPDAAALLAALPQAPGRHAEVFRPCA